MGNETLPITSLKDLKEVLKLTQNITGIPSYKLDFFINSFIPLFLSKDSPLEKNGIVEDKIAVFSDEMADYHMKRTGKCLSTDNIKKTYLTELKNNGLIDDFKSEVDKRKNAYYPLIDVSQFKTREKKQILHEFRCK
jgi:hypothetical protein